MKNTVKFITFCLSLFFLMGLTSLQAQTLEEILEGHYAVTGKEKMEKVNSISSTGSMTVSAMGNQMQMDYSSLRVRPMKMYTEVSMQGMTFTTVFTGEEGWMINPMMGEEPQDLPEEQFNQVKRQADMDGYLINYEEKGYTVEYEGEDEVEGTPAYKIRVKPSEEEEDMYLYLDKDSYVLLKVDTQSNMQGQIVEAEIFFGNYKEVEGIPIAHSMETRVDGETMMEMIFDEITLNAEVDESLFVKPTE